jgi:capsular exopolysaccharide synthesis family protein
MQVINTMSQSTNKRSLVTDVNPRSPISEAYRIARTNVDFSMVDEQLTTLMVTSAGPGEGKTTTVANLAITYAQTGKKVVVIDADMRKPTMHHCFSLSNRIGLSNILTSQLKLDEGIKETHIPGLFVIPSGTIPPNPSEILGSKRMEVLLGELKSKFDLILFDTPPSLVVADAQITASLCDGVILVIDSGKVKRDHAMKMKMSFELVNAKILGTILNNKDRNDAESYYYYYYYYGNRE